ncbi:sialate O-acetylesterase [Microbacterium sp. 4-7]|uniref:sialate O-acetylesterase n=1 Tax=Microbacterium sp. 4-7 TaxID=1885327 RepID=UPI0016505B7F|nr:sialate O-acetylesterase [Microbacterium sp. 4-7]MBC6496117.1 hypothetical protein [Microbacterium sp. 4-7]
MVLVKAPRVRFATDESMATITKASNSAFRAALETVLGTVAAGVIADNPAIIAALEAQSEELVGEALSEAGIARFVDPFIPSPNQWPADSAYALRETDRLGRMSRGILAKDGTQHLPLARIDQLMLGNQRFVTKIGARGSGVAWAITDALGRMSDLAIGEDGRLLPHVINRIASLVGGGGTSVAGYDLGVCAGQSNADEAGYLVLPAFREEDSRLFVWEGGQIVPLAASKVFLGAEFVRAYAKHAARTGRRVLLVPTGVGSIGFTTTSIQPAPEGYRYFANGTWDRTLTADTKNRFSMMVSAANAALAAAGPGSRIVALVWSQGEADGGLTQEQYAAKLDDLITAARTAWNTPTLPVIVGSMTPEMHSDHPDFEHIARALADTPRRLERVGFVWGPTNGHRYNQTVHYSYAGQIERAGRMAREGFMEALANTATNEPVAPLHMRVSRSGGTATVEWDRPMCRVTALLAEFSTNYDPANPTAATWTAATVDTMHGSRATAPVPTATAVAFRITVTNAVGSTMPAVVTG